MTTTTTTWWRCLSPDLPPALRVDCDARGIYEQAGSGGAAEKHVRLTGHPTETTIRAEVGERWLGDGS